VPVARVVVRPAAGPLEQGRQASHVVVGRQIEAVHTRRRIEHQELLEVPGAEIMDGRIAGGERRVGRGADPELRAKGVQILLRGSGDRRVIRQRSTGDEGVDSLVVGGGRQRDERGSQKSALHRRESTRARSRGMPSTLCAPYQEKSRPPQRTTRVPRGSAARNAAASSSENGCGSSGSRTISGARWTTSSSEMRGYRVSRVPAGRGTAWP